MLVWLQDEPTTDIDYKKRPVITWDKNAAFIVYYNNIGLSFDTIKPNEEYWKKKMTSVSI